MGMGLDIAVSEEHWPTEVVTVVCGQCGSILTLTRYQRLGVAVGWVPPGETEQYCPVCGEFACEEPPAEWDFFSRFR